MFIYNNTSTNNTQDDFNPTWLYIKQHKITGLLYFGKTTGSEKHLLERYHGSGDYWTDHINKHGKEHVETIWYCLFVEKDELVKFALMCSDLWNIVGAKDVHGKKIWANMKPENGLDGNPPGVVLSELHKTRISASGKGKLKGRVAPNTGIPHTLETRNKIGAAHKNIPKSITAKQNMSLAKKDKPKIKVCRLCDQKVMDISNFIGWVNKINRITTTY
jgi:hypothetical protein